MNYNELISDLSAMIDERQPALDALDRYYEGTQQLAFLAPEARKAVGNRMGRIGVNLCRLAISSLTERLRITGFQHDGATDQIAWDAWLASDMDQRAALVHREALLLARSFVTVWAAKGRPNISIESAHQMAVQRDPGTREIIRAVKRWETPATTELVLYEPDVIRRFRAEATGATAGFKMVDAFGNPLGWVPVVEFCNSDRVLSDGASELADLIPLVDSLNKVLADMMVGSEFYARPRRWATGIELEEDEHGAAINPYPANDRMMIAETPDAKFGQLPGSDLASYKAAVEILCSQIMAVSGLPSHYMGVLSNQPPSADALRASEASLTSKAEAKQASFGRSWERVARLVHGVAEGVDPDQIDVSVTWADPSTRSIAQEADAVVKLFQAGILPASYALRRLGYPDHEIDAIRAARRAEQLDALSIGLATENDA